MSSVSSTSSRKRTRSSTSAAAAAPDRSPAVKQRAAAAKPAAASSAEAPSTAPDEPSTFASFVEGSSSVPADAEGGRVAAADDAATEAPEHGKQKRAKVEHTPVALKPAESMTSDAAASVGASTSDAAASGAAAVGTAGTGAITPLKKLWSYHPQVIPSAADRTRLYNSLRELVNPEPGKLFLYGKHHLEKRLTGSYARRAGSFTYSGTAKHLSGHWPEVLEEIHEIAARVAAQLVKDTGADLKLPTEAEAGWAKAEQGKDKAINDATASNDKSSLPCFDTVLINYYRDGADSIAWHADKDGSASTIASFSLGAERDFLIRARPPRGQSSVKGLETHKLPLADGSLLLMLPGMQDKYHHSLPARKGLARGRINVTFRSHGRDQSEQPTTVKI